VEHFLIREGGRGAGKNTYYSSNSDVMRGGRGLYYKYNRE